MSIDFRKRGETQVTVEGPVTIEGDDFPDAEAHALLQDVIDGENAIVLQIEDSEIVLETISSALAGTTDAVEQVSTDLVVVQGKLDDILGEVGDNGTILQIIEDNTDPSHEVLISTATTVDMAAVDCSQFRWGFLQLYGGPASVTWSMQGSNDGTTWVALQCMNVASLGTSPFAMTSLTNLTTNLAFPVHHRFIRFRVTAISGGTLTGAIELYRQAPEVLASWSRPVTVSGNVNVVGTANTGDAIGAGTNTVLGVVGFNHVFNGTNWDRVRSAGGGVVLVEERAYSFSRISTSTTTTVKSGAGKLHSVVIAGNGLAATATLYDNTAGSGTVIAALNVAGAPVTVLFDVAFATGLTVVTTGAPDITITYR